MSDTRQHERRWSAFRSAWAADERGERCPAYNGPTGMLQCEMPDAHDGVHQARSVSGDWHAWPDYSAREAAIGVKRLRARVAQLERENAALRSGAASPVPPFETYGEWWKRMRGTA